MHDVESTLALDRAGGDGDIPLLRSAWATIIPGNRPWRCWAQRDMCVLNYSLDNLLMALTIAVGFVVDDAIVMLRHLSPHEAGLSPLEATQDAGEIGFTIMSISISLSRCSFRCC